MSEPSVPAVPESLPAMLPGSDIETEWNFFRREWQRLLAEGHEGRWVLLKGEEIIGIFDTLEEAKRVGVERFGLGPKLIQQVLRKYRVYRAGNYWRCPPP
jgi:hypothetical protein